MSSEPAKEPARNPFEQPLRIKVMPTLKAAPTSGTTAAGGFPVTALPGDNAGAGVAEVVTASGDTATSPRTRTPPAVKLDDSTPPSSGGASSEASASYENSKYGSSQR